MAAARKLTSANAENQRALGRACPLNETLPRVSARWKMQVLHSVAHGVATFGALKRALPGISDHLLAMRLNELVEESLLDRGPADVSANARRSSYRATVRGAELLAIMAQLCAWECASANAASGTTGLQDV